MGVCGRQSSDPRHSICDGQAQVKRGQLKREIRPEEESYALIH